MNSAVDVEVDTASVVNHLEGYNNSNTRWALEAVEEIDGKIRITVRNLSEGLWKDTIRTFTQL